MMSNAFCNLIKIFPVERPFSNPVLILSVGCSGNSFFENQIEICEGFFLLEIFCVWSWIIFSIIFDGEYYNGVVALRVTFGSFFKKKFDFCNFTTSREQIELDREIKNWEIGLAKILVPSSEI